MKKRSVFVAIAVLLLLVLFKPLGLALDQAVILGSLLAAVILWATGGLNKSLVCLILLLVFELFSPLSRGEILGFAYSDTMFLIIFTTLLSVGMMNSGALNGFIEKIFVKTSHNMYAVLAIPYVLGFIFCFLIPQAFARVIILGSVYAAILYAQTEDEREAKRAILFNLFFAVVITYMAFINGDIVLNGAALSSSTDAVIEQLTAGKWALYMFVPTLVTAVISIFAMRFIFKKELSHFHSGMIQPKVNEAQSGQSKAVTIGLILVVVALWLTEGWHGIPQWFVAMLATAIMFVIGVLKQDDLKSVNLHFLLFLTTVFSIGKVLGASGVTEILFQNLSRVIVSPTSPFYFFMLAVVVMVLHILIGSAVATLSVVLPILLPMVEAAGFNGIIMTLLSYIAVNIHFIFPFHHATLMLGAGEENHYPDNYMTRMGIVLTVGALLIIFGIYIPWWKLTGLM